MNAKLKSKKRQQRHKRVRAKIFGTKERPRLCIFRSNKHIYAQLIDDEKGKTLVAASDCELKESQLQNQKSKLNKAKEMGKLIAKRALEKKIEKVVFDRGGYLYHGRVKAVGEGAREGGLKF